MVEEMINELITVAVGLSILGGAYLVWLLSGIANVLFTEGRKWSWKRMVEDLAKTALMCIAILSWVAVFNVLDWFSKKMGADISAILDGASVTGVIGGIIGGTVYFIGKGYKNFYGFINTAHTQIPLEEGKQDYRSVAEKIYEVFETPSEVVEAHKEFEEEKEAEGDKIEGGLGNYYSVPHDTYDHFRAAVIGKGFDLDGKYSYQCWDGACLLWQQIGRWLQTGNGCAAGCWTLKRNENAGNDFELITNKANVKRGDVVVFSCGQYGHIGFADEDYNGGAYIRLLGQNQSADMKFCVINMSMATFLGAFRFKAWKPAPAPTPSPAKKSNEEIAAEVIAGKWGNNPERKKRLEEAGYDYNAIQDLVNRKIAPSQAPATLPDTVAYTYKKGDTFGQVILNLGFNTSHGLWGTDGDVAYYTEQLHQQGIYGNIPIGTTIRLTRRAS